MKLFLIFFFIGLQLTAQENTFRKGVVQDSIPINDSISETYALYLPMAFDGRTPMPVIFVFDDQGRGKKTARLFKNIGEQQGYIIASSNAISQEKSLKENVISGARLINALSGRFPVNYELLLTTGTGMGAKVATSLPLIFKNIFGVLPVSDFHINLAQLDTNNPFIFLGMVGSGSFSLYTMRDMASALEKLGFTSAVYVYEGTGEWPTPRFLSSAVGSMSLQAMRENLVPQNRNLITQRYEKDLDLANKMISNQDYSRATWFLSSMQDKYDGLISAKQVRDKQKQLENSPSYIEGMQDFNALKQEEIATIKDYIYLMDQDIRTANFENLGWWEYQKVTLKELIKENKGEKVNTGNRLLDLLRNTTAYKSQQIRSSQEATFQQELMATMLVTIFNPQNYEAYKKIISMSARDNDYSTALFYLEEMLKNGFQDTEALYNIDGTLGLKFSPKYNGLIEKYLGTSKYYQKIQE